MAVMWNTITSFFLELGKFWSWLSEPIEELGGWQPITIISLSGLLFILAFWIIKLINPLS